MVDTSSVSYDAQAITLLVSSIATERASVRPFGPKAWSAIERRLRDRGLTPGDLLGAATDRVDGIAADEAEQDRMTRLLARAGQLAFELDRLASRGIWVLTRADDGYPRRLRERLGDDAPPVLFGAGERSLLDTGGIAIVGSRDVDEAGTAFAERLATSAAAAGTTVVSGGARGVDQVAMRAAHEAGGSAVGVLPEGIERRLREGTSRGALADGRAVLVSPYHPGAAFSAGTAMGRNRLIYGLADVAVVVSSAAGSGGTWAGATEALEASWVPVLVRSGADAPAGNSALSARGAGAIALEQIPDGSTAAALAALAGASRPGDRPELDEVIAAFEQQRLFPAD